MHSLSARLLILTVSFVMLSEVFIFVPSLARFRIEWLELRLGNAHLAMLVLDATPDRTVGEVLKLELLSQVGAHVMLVRRDGARLVLSGDTPPPVAESFFLADEGQWQRFADAMAVLVESEDRVIRVLSPSPRNPGIVIELVLDEAPLRADMIDFGWRIFLLSLVISFITATLVYLALHWLLVRPMRRITEAMVSFRSNPEDARRIVVPSGRRDEIGTAERELARMQRGLRAALTQKAHLAALGTAVAKINHDLRGILSSALLVSDRLEESEDPKVRRLAPTLVDAIERASALCGQTLDYAGRDQPEPERRHFPLQPLVREIKSALEAAGDNELAVENEVIDGFDMVGDRDQIYRVLANLARNAMEAGARTITVSARRNEGFCEIDVADDGPGLAPRARDKLFRPFEGSARAGGTGLGLAISRELARAHGGDLELLSTGAQGTVFRVRFPLDTSVHDSVTESTDGP